MTFFTKERMNEVDQYIQELRRQDDRSCVIMIVARIEFLLRKAIKCRLLEPRSTNDEKVDSLSFSICVSLSCRLGLVHPIHAAALDELGKLRNKAAHFDRTVSFGQSRYGQHIRAFAESWQSAQPGSHFHSLYKRELTLTNCEERALFLTTASIFFVFFTPLPSITPRLQQVPWLSRIPTPDPHGH